MKTEILKRAMFAMPLSKESRNSGIMSGFDMDEMEGEMDRDENAEMEQMPAMSRTPQNPEILMNNLRGDMRSVDARYQELAQMVGEEAAMDTPPEVLAMLQTQLAMQQQGGGIGALPQAQGMMPPGGQPPMGGAPAPAPQQPGAAMPQGGIPMPQGMESAPPFSQGPSAPQQYAHGGAVEPPTPDGMPPMHAFLGAFVNPAMRAAQFMSDKAGAANAALGRMFMQPSMTQPFLENVRGPGGRYTAEQIARGGELLYPTFTQGMMQGASRFVDQYPRLAGALKSTAAFGSVPAYGLATRGGDGAGEQSDLVNQIPVDTAADRAARLELMSKPPSMTYDISAPKGEDWTSQQGPEGKKLPIPFNPVLYEYSGDPFSGAGKLSATPEQEIAQGEAPAFTPEQERAQGEGLSPSTMPLGDFISKTQAAQEKQGPKTKMERIKEAQGEYAPLFEEIFGSDKEAAKMNALLLLSEAGLKLATIGKPTAAMAVGEAFAGVPRGMAAIAAQERELALKGKTATLQQAITDVTTEDKFLQALKLKALEGDYRLLGKLAEKNQVIAKDAGVGLINYESKDGSYLGTFLNQDHPTIQDIRKNYNYFDTSNPFVRDAGSATAITVTNPKDREKIVGEINLINDNLSKIEYMKSVVQQAYGPGAFVSDIKNNIFVPVLPDALVSPNTDLQKAATILRQGFDSVSRLATANEGRLSTQQQRWAQENSTAVKDPTALLKNPELAAATLNSLATMYKNEWNDRARQLGIGTRELVMSVPNTGTKNDPFVIPNDDEEKAKMANFLQSTLGKSTAPGASVYIKRPNGEKVLVPVSSILGASIQ